jgi:hypothetical protein
VGKVAPLQGIEVYDVLKQLGATNLYHANSVTTSCTFLEQGGLLSRGFIEDRGLEQTEQTSDEDDRKFGIWHRIFLDNVDIHARAGRKVGPNQYGPVLFIFGLELLRELPAGARILVTRTNPAYWQENERDKDRWFRSIDDLANSMQLGDFNKMLVIEIPSERLDFQDRRALILLDDPQRPISSGENAYAYAKHRLTAAAGRVKAHVEPRNCQSGCICVAEYAKYTPEEIDLYFT